MGKTPFIAQLRASAEAAKSFTASLFSSASEAILELEKTKADKPSAVSVTIPASGWGSDSTAGYPYYYDLTVPGVTAKDRASVDMVPEAIGTAADCDLCPACETLAGKIRLRAKTVPAAAMTAEYWLEKGAETP